MEPRPIGFDLSNTGDDATVAPAPIYPPHESNLYPPIDPTNGTPGQAAQMNPIGFEMQAVAANEGPTEVVSEKFPIKMKGYESEVVLSDPGGHYGGVKVRLGEEARDEDSMFFDDGVSRIDYILAHEPAENPGPSDENRAAKRKYYENMLEAAGLKLEHEGMEKSKSGKVDFIKIHAPWDILARGAELMNMKMPLAPMDMELDFGSLLDCIPTPFDLDKDLLDDDDNYFTAPFNRSRLDQFIIKDKDSFFTNAQRSRIVFQILARTFYEDAHLDNPNKRRFGIKKLLANGAYSAAYPLHDGRYLSEHSLLTRGKMNDRHLLYELWARPKQFFKYQPLDQVRNYFGEKNGIYFAWLGYYTMMLIPASIVGLIAFIYGCATIFDDELAKQICDVNQAGNLTMCPLCDGRCTYWILEESCSYSRATYLFDNPATVAFACFMALWASFFHELWKRKQAELGYDWDVSEFENEEETVRPEFENKVRRKRENPINKKEESYVPNWSKCYRYFTTVSVILFFLCCVCAAVFGVIIYRIVVSAVLASSEDKLLRARASIVASATAACINLVIIVILNFVYQRIAEALTEIESHRTETEWEDAFTFKMFLFQFVNYYASILYIAFFKGRFTGRPGDYDYNLLGYRQEECDPAGCYVELCIQLAIIMVGKQAFANIKEIVLPKVMVWFKSRSVQADKEGEKVYTRWEQDYNLADIPKLGLFDEYLEMVIQYGFVTVFVAAFPLAPLCALINNIIEIRLDAYKFVTQWKRPLASRAQDLGVWFGILSGISAIAVVSNAAIIAFTSEFIPRMVYKYGYSEDQSMRDYYQNFSMSYFSVNDFQPKSQPDDIPDQFTGISECRYRDFRQPPNGADPYHYTMAFWHVMAARFAFIVVFENLIVFLSWLVMYMIPDMPYTVKMMMLREKFLSKQAIFHADSIKEGRTEEMNRL